jgi:uncharacterized membrane protein YdbT with pleckstrin-like domain
VGFDEKNLHRDEQIVLDLHPHWIVFAKSLALLVVLTVFGAWVYWGLELDNDTTRTVVRGATALAVIASLVFFLQQWVVWISTNFVVTTDRCIYREGVVSKRGIEIPHERINTVFFEQGIIDRMLGAGTLTIESAGENGMQTFRNVHNPIRVQQELYQQMEDNENRKFDRIRGPASLSVAEELERLVALRDSGDLSDAEFAAQKTRLLSQQ